MEGTVLRQVVVNLRGSADHVDLALLDRSSPPNDRDRCPGNRETERRPPRYGRRSAGISFFARATGR